MARERILFMGGPGGGKSHQLIKVCKYLETKEIPVFCIDCEDKLEATLKGMGGMPSNLKLYVAIGWEEVKEATKKIEEEIKPGNWIMIDRVDLTWPGVQRWYTQGKYDEELADRLMAKAKEMKKPSMFIPRFDQGAWQVINEQHETFMLKILYRHRTSVLLTAGIRGLREGREGGEEIGRASCRERV